MDLNQRKLSKAEWDSIEIPVSGAEIEILKLITSGYNEVNIKNNKTHSLFSYLKIEFSEKMEEFLYTKYCEKRIKKLIQVNNLDYIKIDAKANVTIKKADQIRLSQNDANIETLQDIIFEFVLITHLEKLMEYKAKNNKKWMFYYFTIHKLIKNNINKLNRLIKDVVCQVLEKHSDEVDLLHIICNSVEFIEQNKHLLKYSDMVLYDHQKTIFTACKVEGPKLVLYIAPTGTGKTLTPLGLSENHRVIFVCAARHVGLALARSAISIHKKIAFAFGCSSTEDVRLHYFSAKEYTINKRSGGIRKVDNTVGDKVEIIVCDIKSYLYAMYYMLAFNKASDIITYWDEPTITLDYQSHEFHEIIKRNWSENLIPNFVLSSATLPKAHELTETITDFKAKFPKASINNIVSHDCRKTIPLINNKGYVIMPHYLHTDYDEVCKIASHCEENLTLLRYFDLKEVSNFIYYCETNNCVRSVAKIHRNFGSIDDIDMKSIKIHYLKALKNIIPGTWGGVYISLKTTKERRIVSNDKIDTKGNRIQKVVSVGPGITSVTKISNDLIGTPLVRLNSEQIVPPAIVEENIAGIYVTTKDAFTLTDGPSIFLASDVRKIAKFCIQQANIPSLVMTDIMNKIEFNNTINEKITLYEEEIETEISKNANKEESTQQKTPKDKKNSAKTKDDKVGASKDKKVIQLQNQIDMLRSMIKLASLNDIFIPNKIAHIQKWASDFQTKNSFTSNIDEETIMAIMRLKNVEDSWKILLLMGIGVFTTHDSSEYTEIMKKLADNQHLYLIIADSDYIYGTNYQFCHGYLSKDMKLSQEKIIQALGRIGRNNIQQEYSVRFRDDEQVNTLFKSFLPEEKPEVVNMNVLFTSRNIEWNAITRTYVPK
jgi:hypothetical protein